MKLECHHRVCIECLVIRYGPVGSPPRQPTSASMMPSMPRTRKTPGHCRFRGIRLQGGWGQVVQTFIVRGSTAVSRPLNVPPVSMK